LRPGYGRLASVSSNIAGASVLANAFLRQSATDRLHAWKFGNGLPRLVSLDTDGRITQLASTTAHSLNYGYTSSANTIEAITDNVYGVQSESIGYDQNDRVKTVTRSGDNQSIGWDTSGNRKTGDATRFF
jgi:hypothetical protein